MKRWGSKITCFPSYLVAGFITGMLLFGRALLGYDHSFYSDGAPAALVFFIMLWAAVFPFLILTAHAIEVVAYLVIDIDENLKSR